ncbi:GNAT family N-acetyltransferase [Nocardioides cheoyonin]|uniref:GNAT family N-acetyltransferase n=1 Tax=Nocardioides cheoyonin TaxID=3156615 RepID=UPI0032B555B3
MTGFPTVFRAATEADVEALTDLEQAANEKSLGHLFGGRPFPRDDVAATWRTRLGEPATVVEVVEEPGGGLAALLCYDAERLQHLAVHPDRWGSGLARAAVERAVAAIPGDSVLWCLEDNTRARGLYEHLGWVLSGRTSRSQYPPYLPEVEYVWRRRG